MLDIAQVQGTLEHHLLEEICKTLGILKYRIRYCLERHRFQDGPPIRYCHLRVHVNSDLLLGLYMERGTIELYRYTDDQSMSMTDDNLIYGVKELADPDSLRRASLRQFVREARVRQDDLYAYAITRYYIRPSWRPVSA